MNLVVIGLGSMGKRRIRLIKQVYTEMTVYGVDKSMERRKEVEALLEIETSSDLEGILESKRPIAAFVCSSPLTHGGIIDLLLERGIHVFTELNLVQEGYPKWLNRENPETFLFLSSTLVYRKDIQYIARQIQGRPVNYIYHSGQYLPDWHPWESYKNFFVGDKRTNGCREIFAIELPWLIKAFGEIDNIYVMKSNLSSLDLDYADNYIVSVQHKNGSKGSLCVDVVARKAIRQLEVFSEEIHLFWEGTPHSLREYDSVSKTIKPIQTYELVERDAKYCENIIENAYKEEVMTFLEAVLGGEANFKYSLEEDFKVLNLINEIEGKRF